MTLCVSERYPGTSESLAVFPYNLDLRREGRGYEGVMDILLHKWRVYGMMLASRRFDHRKLGVANISKGFALECECCMNRRRNAIACWWLLG